ncbi:MAG: hypothetical protein AAF657_26420, partial [Acidobacteriota bacterium]
MDVFKAPSCLLVLLSLLGQPYAGNAQGSEPPPRRDVQHWREDLRVLSDAIREKHRDPFHQVTRQQFDAAVAQLDRRIPKLEPYAVIAELARLVALLQDGHTRLTLPVSRHQLGLYQGHSNDPPANDDFEHFHVLPLRLYLYDDGLFVRQATAEHRSLAGAKVVQIGTKTAAEALAAIRPFIPIENESSFRLVAPTRLAIPEMLAAAGIVTEIDPVRFVFETAQGRRTEHALAALPRDGEPEWVHARDLTGAPAPLWAQNNDAWYWFEHLPAADAVYVQLNRIGSHADESLSEFVERLVALIEAQSIDRVILDLRHNSGGNGYLNRTLVLALIRWQKAIEPGHLYVITGRKTFSAAIQLCTALEQYTQVTFVGEEIGGKTSHYGDSRKTILPHSGLTLRTSTVYWRDWSVDENRGSIVLDLPAPLTSGDDSGGHDPALAAALGHELPRDRLKQLVAVDQQSGFDSATVALYRQMTDIAAGGRHAAEGVKGFASHLAKTGRLQEARFL